MFEGANRVRNSQIILTPQRQRQSSESLSSDSVSQIGLESSESIEDARKTDLQSRSQTSPRLERSRSEVSGIKALTESDLPQKLCNRADELGSEKLARNARKPGLYAQLKDSDFGQFSAVSPSQAPPFADHDGCLVISNQSNHKHVQDPGTKAKFNRDTFFYTEDPRTSQSKQQGQTIQVSKGDKCTVRQTDTNQLVYIEKYSYQNDKLKIEGSGYALARDVSGNFRGQTHLPLKSKAPIFPHAPRPSDVKQGAMGDCFFLAALASIVGKDPDLVTRMIKDHGDGTVTVRLFDVTGTAPNKTFTPKYLSFEKSILHTDFALVPERANAAAPWVCLMEKAYASHLGSYAKLNEGGHVSDAYEALLGKPADLKLLAERSLDRRVNSVFLQSDGLVPKYIVSGTGLQNLKKAGLHGPEREMLRQLGKTGTTEEDFETLLRSMQVKDSMKDKIRKEMRNPDDLALYDFAQSKLDQLEAIRNLSKRDIDISHIEALFKAPAQFTINSTALAKACSAQKTTDEEFTALLKLLAGQSFKDQDDLRRFLTDAKTGLNADKLEGLLKLLSPDASAVKLSKNLQSKVLGSFSELLAPPPRGSGNYTRIQEDLFEKISKNLKAGMIMSAGTPEKIQEDRNSAKVGKAGEEIYKGLVGGHAFSITGAITLDNTHRDYPGPKGGPPLCFIEVRNPWGNLPSGLSLIPSQLLNLAGVPEHGSRKYRSGDSHEPLKAYGSRKAEYLVELSDFSLHFSEISYSQP